MFKNADVESVYQAMKHRESIVFTGRLSPEDLKYVMGAAKALTFVPYFEGFGIPIVEAMACDVPVITSNITSMPEVAGDAALLIDPYSVNSIKDAMVKIFSNESLCLDLISKARIQRNQFSWDKSAERLWTSIEKAINAKL